VVRPKSGEACLRLPLREGTGLVLAGSAVSNLSCNFIYEILRDTLIVTTITYCDVNSATVVKVIVINGVGTLIRMDMAVERDIHSIFVEQRLV